LGQFHYQTYSSCIHSLNSKSRFCNASGCISLENLHDERHLNTNVGACNLLWFICKRYFTTSMVQGRIWRSALDGWPRHSSITGDCAFHISLSAWRANHPRTSFGSDFDYRSNYIKRAIAEIWEIVFSHNTTANL